MAGFFDIGREKARHIVEKVSKATHLRDADRSGSSGANMDASSKVPTTQKTYGFTTFKRALDDTDTLLLRDTSFNRTFSLSRTSEPAANTSPSTEAGTGRTECSRLGSTAGHSAWDLPLTSFVKAPRATVPHNLANEVSQTAPTSTATVEEHDNGPTTEVASQSAFTDSVDTTCEPPANAAAADEDATCSAVQGTESAAAFNTQHGSFPGPTTAPAAAAACEAGSTATAGSAASSDIDAVLDVPASALHNSKPAAKPHHIDPATATAAPTVSRPGVADAANLIAPGLVAKRRMAAIAAVESKEGPSPELQATPVIITEGAGEKSKSGSRVKLSAW